MNILITGSGGYIGSAPTDALLRAGHSVTVSDSLITGHRQAVSRRMRFIHAGLADKEKLARSLVYSLGNGNGYSIWEVIHIACLITGCPLPAVEQPTRGEVPRLAASSEKICRELGWQPEYPDLKGIVASACKWHRLHPDGYGETG